MTHPPAPAASSPTTQAHAAARMPRQGAVRHALGRTPGRLTLLGAIAVLASLACGLLGYLGGSAQASALDQARADTTQLTDVQAVRNTLVAADATATNAFLVGGLEPVGQRTAYNEAIQRGATDLIHLSGSNPSDATSLATANAGLVRYTGLIEQARATNRQGLPVGSAYLDQASTLLREEVTPALDALVLANADRTARDFSTAGNAPAYLAIALVFVAMLVAGQIWLARRTRRIFNFGLATATVLLLVAGGIGAIVLNGSSSTARDVRSGPYAGTLALSQAYALANDAKSAESFTLIKRGSGEEFEVAFATASTAAVDRLSEAVDAGNVPREVRTALQHWIENHAEIRALDDAGDWDGAVLLAVAQGPGSSAADFLAFEEATQDEARQSTATVQDELRSAARGARIVGWAMLLAGVGAAVLAWRGVAQRLKEYR